MNQVYGRVQEAFMRGNIDHSLDNTNGLIEDRPSVSDEIGDRQGTSLEVGLQEKVRLHVGALKVVLGDLNRYKMSQSFIQDIFVVSHRKPSELLGVRQDGDELRNLSLRPQLVAHKEDGLMGQIVVRGKIPQSGRSHSLVLLVELDAPGRDQLAEVVSHQIPQVAIDRVRDVPATFFCLEAVVCWVLRQPSEEVSPCQIVDAVLEFTQGSRGDLGVEMVCQLASEGALDGEGLVEELLVEVLLFFGDHHAGDTAVIELRTAGTTDHLEEVGQWEVDVSLQVRVIELSTLYYDKSRREVDTPSQGTRSDEHLNLL
mmetsp:Transcript_12631/g.19643  ORF Transcript_12631/g.19643 Transcript_12631/m.19643 type:complete len:314 (-) Transcript_12631:2895-3836(-)